MLEESMKDIRNGWIDKDNYYHLKNSINFFDDYRLQSPNKLIKTKIGNSIDQVELERYVLKNKCKSYFIVSNKNYFHSFIVIDNVWYEHSWKEFEGTHKYTDFELLIEDIYNNFLKKHNLLNAKIYEYDIPNYGITYKDFYNHCVRGREIK